MVILRRLYGKIAVSRSDPLQGSDKNGFLSKADSIILCNQITKIFILLFFFHYSSEFSVKDQQFSINLIQTLLKSANFQGNPLPLIQFNFILSTTDTLNYLEYNKI